MIIYGKLFMIGKPSILVGIGKTVKRIVNHQWFVGIAGGIIVGVLLYLLLEEPDVLVEITEIVGDYMTIPRVLILITCVIVIGIARFLLHRRERLRIVGLGAIVILFIMIVSLYHQVSVVKEFIDANINLVAFLGLLIAIPPFLHLFLTEKKKDGREITEKESDEKETIEEEKIEKDDTEEEPPIPSPISGLCLGRDTELVTLEKNLTQENVILIKGIAGIGKTTLGLKFRDVLEEKGYHTYGINVILNHMRGS